MANLKSLLALIPEGPEYELLRGTLSIIAENFADQLPEISTNRLSGWLSDIQGGEIDPAKLRENIFRHVVEADVLQNRMGVDAAAAEKLISGEESFSEFFQTKPAGGGVSTKGGTPEEEGKAGKGVGGGGADEETQLTILTSKTMKWHFDRSSGLWYVSYTMANSGTELLFEASPTQMNALFGTGQRPTEYRNTTFKDYTKRKNVMFAGDITEMAGTGSFESEMSRVSALALDEGQLPDWARKDKKAMDFIILAELEEKSDEWLFQKFATLDSFKERFVGLTKFQKENNLSLPEAVQGYLEYEAGIKNILKQYNIKTQLDPSAVGALLNRGYSTKFVADNAAAIDRFNQNKTAFKAFNGILQARGLKPLTKTKDIIDFMSGRAPQGMYQLYEEAALKEAAMTTGLGKAFSAKDAIRAAKHNLGVVGIEQATQQMQTAAQMLLRFRDQISVEQYGLSQDELLDLSLGIKPRSGRSEAEVRNALSVAVSNAEAFVSGSGSGAYVGFSPEGRPGTQSLGGTRTNY